eukprot:7316425-Pyramimonas_sp.AAC.1
METEGCSAMMVSSLDEIAWLLNVRGGDIAFCPVTLAFAVVEKDKATLYTDQAKVFILQHVFHRLQGQSFHREPSSRGTWHTSGGVTPR